MIAATITIQDQNLAGKVLHELFLKFRTNRISAAELIAVDGEIGACWEVGFVAAACLTAEVVDGGIFFVAADAGIVAADLCGQAGGELPAFLQGLASLVCGAPALFPSLPAPALGLKVVLGHGQ